MINLKLLGVPLITILYGEASGHITGMQVYIAYFRLNKRIMCGNFSSLSYSLNL